MVKNNNKKGRTRSEIVFLILIVLVLVLGTLNVAKAKGWLIPEQNPIPIQDNTVNLNDLTLEQKIAQMVIVHGGRHNLNVWKNMQIGGIHLFAMKDEELFKNTINDFQEDMVIPFFVTVDLEGCWNPFANFKDFYSVSEVKNVGEAFQKGSDEGKFLHDLGFTINYAPVVDLDDEIWNCRTFPGTEEEITLLAEAYILGLQSQGVIATAKHYPGKALVIKDPHKNMVTAEIVLEDIYPYNYLGDKGDVKSMMVTHVISYGEVNSEGKPAVVSKKAVDTLKEKFDGLITTDDTMMLGLQKFFDSKEDLYRAVFSAGNDLIINFNEDPNEIFHMIETVKEAVLNGDIPEEQIDNSVKKILEAKGFNVK